MEVLGKINTENYTAEKERFLSIWNEALLIGIKEIVGDDICPNTVAVFGGGGNNDFIKRSLKNLHF